MKPQLLAPDSGHYEVASDDGAINWACLASLIETCLCRARHKAVYADCRTMPNGLVFPGIHRERRVIGSA
jgi:transposase